MPIATKVKVILFVYHFLCQKGAASPAYNNDKQADFLIRVVSTISKVLKSAFLAIKLCIEMQNCLDFWKLESCVVDPNFWNCLAETEKPEKRYPWYAENSNYRGQVWLLDTTQMT